MRCDEVRCWTMKGLVAAFVDLSVAFLLLCASCLVYLTSKLLGLFGLDLPCPCDGLFSSDPNKNKCFQETLGNLPVKKIACVQRAVRNKTPFDSTSNGDDDCFRKKRKAHGEVDSWVKTTASGFDLLTSQSLKKASFKIKSKQVVRSPPYGRQVSLGHNKKLDEKDPLLVNSKEGLEEDVSLRKSVSLSSVAEQGAAALAVELEKERNAAATAADEALGMILRLQEEKASIEMEARQYQRMMEEKSAFDAEEMNILKEILMRREREKHVLEKEVETYRQMLLDTQPLEEVKLNQNTESTSETEESAEAVSNKLELNVPCDHLKLDRSQSVVSDTSYGLPPASCLRRNSMSAVDYERVKIESEVGLLRGRLTALQKGREMLCFKSSSWRSNNPFICNG